MAGGSGGHQRSASLVLLATSCVPILESVVIAPVLPDLSRQFSAVAGAAGAAVLVPTVLTAPALMISVTVPIAGWIVDATGRFKALVVALIFFAVLGTAPLWLDSLPFIVLSRQTVVTILSSTVFFGLGGALGGQD